LKGRATSKSIKNIISKLVVAVAAYFVWQERNNRIFKNTTRPPDVLSKLIIDTVKCKLIRLKYKKPTQVVNILAEWNIHGGSVYDDGG
jgi:hypothetical protein